MLEQKCLDFFFFTPKNILYFRTEHNAHVKWAWVVGGGGGGGGGRDSFYHIVIFYDHLIEIVSQLQETYNALLW